MGGLAAYVILALVGVAIAIIVVMAVQRRSSGPTAVASGAAPAKRRATLSDFHVRGNEAQVFFDVPLPDGDVDQVLQDLLTREAVEVVREKRSHLPMEGVDTVVAFGVRNGQPFQVGSLELPKGGELPDINVVDLVPHAAKTGFNPVAAVDSGVAPQAAEKQRSETIAPAGEWIKLTSSFDASLRAHGNDPKSLDAGGLVKGLFEMTGYVVTPAGTDTFRAVGGGQRLFVRVVPHATGDYPELEEGAINKFLIDFGSAGADQGLLVTDKYGPFSVYDKEKRQPKVRFLTRERLQAFVDAMAMS